MKEDTVQRQQHLSETTEASPWNGIVDKLKQSDSHWHDTAQMLKRQRDMAEEERDGWKERAMKAEQERQVARAECEHWKLEWALAMGQLGGARAEVEAVRKAVQPTPSTKN